MLGDIKAAEDLSPASVPLLLLLTLAPLLLLLLLLSATTSCCSGSAAFAAGFAGGEPLIFSCVYLQPKGSNVRSARLRSAD
jgi:hypothetical protein